MLLARRRRATTLLLSRGHAIDHFVLLIFAAATIAVAAGAVFAVIAPREHQPPAKRQAQATPLPKVGAQRLPAAAE